METARYYASASTLPDGRVLVAGGWDGRHYLATTTTYDPRVNVWHVGPSLQQSRYYASQSTMADGKLMVCGGSHGASVTFDSVEVFESDTVLLPPLPSQEEVSRHIPTISSLSSLDIMM